MPGGLKRLLGENRDVAYSLTYEQVRTLNFSTPGADKEFRRLCATLVQAYLGYKAVYDEMDQKMKGVSRLRYALARARLPQGHGLPAAIRIERR